MTAPEPPYPGLTLFVPQRPLPLLVLRQGRTVLCNEAAERFWEVPPGGLCGLPLPPELATPPAVPSVSSAWRRLLPSSPRDSETTGFRYALPDGQGTHVLLLVRRSCCPSGSPIPPERSTSPPLLDLVGNPLLLLGLDGTILGANRPACKRLGIPLEALRRRSLYDVTPPPNQGQTAALHLRALLEGSSLGNGILATQDGFPFPVPMQLFLGFWEGCPLLFLGGRDPFCSLSSESPGDRRRRQRTLRALLGAFPEPAFFLDVQGFFRDCNGAFEALTGLSRDQMTGRLFADLPLDSLSRLDPLESRTLSLDFSGPSGTRQFLLRRSPCNDGKEEGLLGILFDVTERARGEAILREARKAAEEADQAKSAFLAQVSHEIRNPLSTLLGLSELCLGTPLQPRQRHWIQSIHQASTHMLRIANDVLDLSRVEAGKLELQQVPYSLPQLLRDALKAVLPQGEAKGLALALREEPGLPERLLGDPGRIQQILVNLLTNAVKFCDRGRVELRARKAPQGPWLELAVEDTGQGIEPEDLRRVFQPFWQASPSTSAQGMGLGLPIALQLTRSMGGNIEASSLPGSGTTFLVRLPLEEAEAEPSPSLSPTCARAPEVPGEKTPAPLRILLAEDSPMNRELMETVLTLWGHGVTAVSSGRQALEALERDPFDVAILDIQMPDGDGLSTARHIRCREEGTGCRLPLVALTAYAMEEDRIRCLEAGMDCYLAKPVSLQTLQKTLEGLIPPTADLGQSPAPPCEVLDPAPDLSVLADLTGGREDLMRRAVHLFFQGTPLMLENLRVALLRDNPKGVEAAAHRLKGSLSHLGDPEATRLAEELHHLHQEPQEVLLPLLESLENRVERLHAHFRARGWLGEEGE